MDFALPIKHISEGLFYFYEIVVSFVFLYEYVLKGITRRYIKPYEKINPILIICADSVGNDTERTNFCK